MISNSNLWIEKVVIFEFDYIKYFQNYSYFYLFIFKKNIEIIGEGLDLKIYNKIIVKEKSRRGFRLEKKLVILHSLVFINHIFQLVLLIFNE